MQAVCEAYADKSDNGKQKIQGKVIALQQGSNQCGVGPFIWEKLLKAVTTKSGGICSEFSFKVAWLLRFVS